MPIRIYREQQMVEITVELGSRSYPIEIGPGLLATIGDRVKTLRPTRIVIVTNTTVAAIPRRG